MTDTAPTAAALAAWRRIATDPEAGAARGLTAVGSAPAALSARLAALLNSHADGVAPQDLAAAGARLPMNRPRNLRISRKPNRGSSIAPTMGQRRAIKSTRPCWRCNWR